MNQDFKESCVRLALTFVGPTGGGWRATPGLGSTTYSDIVGEQIQLTNTTILGESFGIKSKPQSSNFFMGKKTEACGVL